MIGFCCGSRLFCSEFFHLAGKPIRDETSPVGVPPVVVVDANPLGVRVAVLADIDRCRSVAVRVAAVVSHGWFVGLLHRLEIAIDSVRVPIDGTKLAFDQFHQRHFDVVRQPADDEALKNRP